ncbi:nickel/cobalt transporter [Fertoeibacter niger]|nr:hypothetical protein [Fertoeibacter niger]
MQRRFLIFGLAVAAVLALVWASGALAGLERWAADSQHAVQNAMAGALRRLKGGEVGALAALLAVCFGYGFFHAVGPGHGKVLIGGYGMARRVPLARLAAIALASSLAQATTAVALVYAGIALLGWTRERLVGFSEQWLDPLGYAAIAAIGLWLIARGLRGAGRMEPAPAAAPSPSPAPGPVFGFPMPATATSGFAFAATQAAPMPAGHVHDAHCGCGHAHGPTLDQVENVSSWRDAALLIGGIAIRPCTGALFLLILTWRMQIGAAGIAGAYVMALGTATVTLAVAALSVWAREGALALPGARLARALPLLEITGGAVIVLVAGQLLLRSL